MKRFVHLIPYDGVGGVEIAARSIDTGTHGLLEFERHYLVSRPGRELQPGEVHGEFRSLSDPVAYWHALRWLLRDPPDLLVASLWRSGIVLILLKLLRPKVRTALFLHCPGSVHVVDRVISLGAMYLADSIWADSAATLHSRVPAQLRDRGKVVSFLTEHRPPPEIGVPSPSFVFWGRLNRLKGLDRALEIFAAIRKSVPEAHFVVIGPDGGVEANLRAQIARLGLGSSVSLVGPKSQEGIRAAAREASFYLQTSVYEGMALSVVEAMQSGLVPIVTPVGEIARYCSDGDNAVVVQDDEAAIRAVLALLSAPDHYRAMARRAVEYWQGRPLYKDDLLEAASAVLEKDTAGPGDTPQSDGLLRVRKNTDAGTVDSFADEWNRHQQDSLPEEEYRAMWQGYFSIFPWDDLPHDAIGFDMGAGSGRWAKLVAPRVGTLHVVDPAEAALTVARSNLAAFDNVTFHHAATEDVDLAPASCDFGYSLGVLHHIPDTRSAMSDCARLLKPGAPFLVYLYYRFDNRPAWFRAIWKGSDLVRRGVHRMPAGAKSAATDAIALGVYWPLSRFARLLERAGRDSSWLPLSHYRRHSLKTLRTDSRDRFGTPLEQRFTRDEVRAMMIEAGLKDIRFSDEEPYWVAVGRKA